MASRSGKTNGRGVDKHNGHVSLAREEYDAFVAREESYAELVAENAKNTSRVHDLTRTCDAQAKRMVETSLTLTHLERVASLQTLFIDLLRADASAVASLEDLSEFWRQWSVSAEKAVKSGAISGDEVVKYEPDLFRTWRNWALAAGKVDRTLGEAGRYMTRVEHAQATADEGGQEAALRRERDENAKLRVRAAQLEVEINNYRKAASNMGPRELTERAVPPDPAVSPKAR